MAQNEYGNSSFIHSLVFTETKSEDRILIRPNLGLILVHSKIAGWEAGKKRKEQ